MNVRKQFNIIKQSSIHCDSMYTEISYRKDKLELIHRV